METIGKPVYHNSIPGMYGAWMRESYKAIVSGDNYWLTVENCTNCLHQFINKNDFTNKTIFKTYPLREPFIVSISMMR